MTEGLNWELPNGGGAAPNNSIDETVVVNVAAVDVPTGHKIVAFSIVDLTGVFITFYALFSGWLEVLLLLLYIFRHVILGRNLPLLKFMYKRPL